MHKRKVIESIKSVNYGSTGFSLKLKIAAYNLLEYISENVNYNNLVELIYNYYNEEYNYNNSLTSAKDELESLLSLCCTMLLVGENYPLYEVGLVPKNYTDKDITKFFKFSSIINEKFGFKLKLDAINNLQLKKDLLLQEKLEKDISNMEDKINIINDRIDKIHFDTISIISIFVAVIFALYGNIELASNIINKIDSENYVLMFKTALVLGCVLSILISILISTLSRYDNKNNNKGLIIKLNIALVIITILSWIFLK